MTTHQIRCGSCHQTHPYVEDVAQCYGLGNALYLGPCTWLVEGRDEDGVTFFECGARMFAYADGSGYSCDAGHEHTHAEDRQAQGWEYAEDADEAKRLMRNGVEPRTMDGHVWVS